MRRSLAVTGIITAGLTALALAATPALAQGGPNPNASGTGTCAVTGTAPVSPNAVGMNGGRGQGYGRGMNSPMGGQGINLPASGTLTADQKADVAYMVEEEKLAHDVYVALAAKFPADFQFARIANSEAQHQAALRTILTRYNLTDPTAGLAAGEFSTSAFQKLYNDLVGQATTAVNAPEVGVAIEKLDIVDLTSSLDGVTAPDVVQTYTNLRNASQHHLTAFGG
ncbi:MAG: DUF2202 domain-containing protein [Actinomycetes bacterium]